MTCNQKAEKNLAQFLKKLEKSEILGWAKKLLKKYPQAEVYLVGGAVRDAILGVKDNKDLDFVVRGVPIKKLEQFLAKSGWVELLGRNFGVLKFRPACRRGRPKGLSCKNGFEPLDIALPRSEFSTGPGGYKDFKVKFNKDLNIEQDLLRRDFTINAIAVNLFKAGSHHNLLQRQQIIDPFDGFEDIKNKIIRCVGKPKERLSEDYTRILRVARLVCQLDFKIEPKTKAALKKLTPHLNDQRPDGSFIAPREVIAKELLKTIGSDYFKAITLFEELNLFKILLPEILKMKKCPQPKKFHTEGDVWTHTMLALKNLASKRFINFEEKIEKLFEIKDKNNEIMMKNKLELILAVLFHDLGKPYTLQTPAKDGVDRIRFNDHDNIGADLVRKIGERLALSAPEKHGIVIENLAWLVRKHMILIQGHPSEFRPTTIEKYFFNPKYPGVNLIKLAWLDISATITARGPLDFNLINALLKRIREMKKLVKKKKAAQLLPRPLLDGHEIMKTLKIKPGKRVGEIKNILREKQLVGKIKNKEEAKRYLRNK